MTTSSRPDVAGLRVGFVPGVTLTKWRRIWEERFRRVPLAVLEIEQADQRRALLDGDVDLCFVRLPLNPDGLHAIPLYEEVPVVWLSKEHELTVLDEVSSVDLADVRVIHDAAPDSIELASFSAAVLRVPMSVARSGSRRDMVYRPVVDAPPTTVALAWRTDNGNEWIDEFIGIVRGRTPNSSRTAAERGDEPKPAKPAERPRKGGVAARGSRPPQRGGRPRRR